MGAQWKAKGKAQAADARGKLFGCLAKDIMFAARNGADPSANSRLCLVVEQETLERAIKKGAGLLGDAVSFERVIYEGFVLHQVPVMIERFKSAQFMSHLVNIGDTRTLISHPASTTHRQLDDAQQLAAGVSPDMVRISVGLENLDDILWDIDQALDKASR
eukprot:gene15081-17281_t